MFAVVGLTQDQVVAGPMQQPHMRLAHALDAELQRLGSASGPAEHIVVYGVEPDDFEVMQQLRMRYEGDGRFFRFFYFNDVACNVCAQSGIELLILEHVNEETIPNSCTVVLDHPCLSGPSELISETKARAH